MPHRYPRTERDLRALAVNFSEGNITKALPERLECLAAYHRTVIEAEKANDGKPNDFNAASAAYEAAIVRMLAAGVRIPDGEYTFSLCMGPDREVGA